MTQKKKNKRRYTVVRTAVQEPSKMDPGRKRAMAGAAAAVALLLAGEAVDVMPDHVLLPLIAVCAWFALVQAGWFPILGRRYIHYPGYLVAITPAVVFSVVFAAHKAPGGARDTNPAGATSQAITTTVQNSPGSTLVTSQGQTGGITAQTVNNPVIYNYFLNQPPDEKEQWRQYLMKEYPLGWALVATDGTDHYIPRDLSYTKDFIMRWGKEGVVALTPDLVTFRFPDFVWLPREWTLSRSVIVIKRAVGGKGKLCLGDAVMVAELLADKGDFVVMAVGFRSPNESDRPKSSGSKRANEVVPLSVGGVVATPR